MEKMQRQTEKPFVLFKAILVSWLVTAILLMVLALLMFKMELDESKVSIGIIAVYVISTFFGGRIAGKSAQTRKFLWGMLAGLGYFLVLLVVTLAMEKSMSASVTQLATTVCLCIGGGMLGGMLSS